MPRSFLATPPQAWVGGEVSMMVKVLRRQACGVVLGITKLAPRQGCWGGLNDGQEHSQLGIKTLGLFCRVLNCHFSEQDVFCYVGCWDASWRKFSGRVSEAICLSYEVKIVEIIFYSKFFIQSFLLMIWFFVLVIEKETKIYIFALVNESLITKKHFWINRKHTTLKRELWNRLPRTLMKRYSFCSISIAFSLCNVLNNLLL
jgi:hypothetical protein